MVSIKVLILTQGTRGDVQPFIALMEELTNRGHEVSIGAPPWVSTYATMCGASWIQFSDIERELMSDTNVREAFETNFHGLRGKLLIPKVISAHRSIFKTILKELASCVVYGADLVVYHATLPGHEIAEAIDAMPVPVCLDPIYIPTNNFSNPMISFRIPRYLNRASFWLSRFWVRALQGNTAGWRHGELQLPRQRGHQNQFARPNGSPAVTLQPISRHMLPFSVDYPNWVHTTGFWLMTADKNWEAPSELAEFLDNGDPPVYIGFGSMVGNNPDDKTELVSNAVDLAGVRAIVVGGSGGILQSGFKKRILYLPSVPFDWLFPRMAAVVHHGGSGTTGMAAYSGRPQVLCPSMYGQPFNAQRMYDLGVSPRPQHQRKLTAESLATAIRQAVNDNSHARRANDLATKLRSENGVTNAASILESINC